MKTQTRKQQKTNYVLVDDELLKTNIEVEKAYTLIVGKAIELLDRFELNKFRTYCDIEHTKNEQNTNLVKEHLSFHWNITLSLSPKNGKSYMFIDLGLESLQKFGSNLTNQLLRYAYQVTDSHDNTKGIEYALRITFLPAEQLHNFFFRRVVEGETGYVSLHTVEKSTEVN
ncbi:MAG: hypothetical protein EOO42_15065 [Flavobacteriales bacterium]|nr:MAG: hypothetical protein EOO42_15065 [Flavobacteriales bacterium]